MPARYMLAFMALFGMFTVYSLRLNMSTAIVAMVDYGAVNELGGINQSDVDESNRSPKCDSWVKVNRNKSKFF